MTGRVPHRRHHQMATPKTETLTVRLSPEVKAQLREAATQQQRSLANMLSVMIRYWAETADTSPSPRRERVQASRSAD